MQDAKGKGQVCNLRQRDLSWMSSVQLEAAKVKMSGLISLSSVASQQPPLSSSSKTYPKGKSIDKVGL
jgi:hypothetical protein